MSNELDRRRGKRDRTTQISTEQPGAAVRHPDHRHKTTGVNKSRDRLQAAIYRITEQQSISPGELARETEEDAELCHVRTLLLANQLDRLPEPYSQFKNSLSTKYGLIFQDEQLVVPAGLQTAIY